MSQKENYSILESKEISKENLLKILDNLANSASEISRFQKNLSESSDIEVLIKRNSSILVVKSLGLSLLWDIFDPRTAIACLAATGSYEQYETHLLGKISQESRYLIDVGANVGYYSLTLPKLSKKLRKIYAFEPIPSAFSKLEANIKLNGLQNVVDAFNLGISNRIGKQTFYSPEFFGTSATSSQKLHPEVQNNEFEIEITTLDSLYSSGAILGCDLLKIDVEGAEKFVIQGANRLIAKYKPVIFAELLRKWSKIHGYHPNEVVSILRELGYSCWGVGTTLTPILEISDLTLETNFIFLNNKKKAHKKLKKRLGLL